MKSPPNTKIAPPSSLIIGHILLRRNTYFKTEADIAVQNYGVAGKTKV